MSDRDALLAAIRANPEDDTPRLVFADWLDEHAPDAPGRGKKKADAPSAWAALIRAECALARLEEDDSASAALFEFFATKDEQSLGGVRWDRADPGVGRRVELRNLSNRVRQPATKALVGGRPKGPLGGFFVSEVTHRGFPKRFQITDSEKFAPRLPELIASCPAVRLDVDRPRPKPDELVAAGLARWCRELQLTASHQGRLLIEALSCVPETVGIRALYLSAAHGLDAGLALIYLFNSPHWAGLRALTLDLQPDLAERAKTTEVVASLSCAKHLRGLRRLTLRNGGDIPELIPALAGLSELRALTLTECGLTDADAELLANPPGLSSLRTLDLQHNQIGGRGASALIASRHLPNLAVLDLDHNPIRNLDRAALASAPAGGLRTIGFHGARLTVRDITALTTSPRLSELVYFDADHNELAETAVARLVRGFGDRPPAVLYLVNNNIREAGIEALTTWPAAANIDMLHLGGNTLPTASAKAIAACPHLKQLSHLCAGTAHPAGRKALKKCFGARAFV